MGQKKNSSFKSPDYFHRLSKALQFAVSEWLLMFLLFIDACFTYLIAKFASYCQLQGPCVLCSRYDHVLAKDKTGIYWDSICNHHKSEISSLVISHVNGICENCLANNRFDDETFRLLVGKMGSGRLRNLDSSGSRMCFCCNEQYVSRDGVKNLVLANSIHNHASESLITNDEHAKSEKNIFVDESLESLSTDGEHARSEKNIFVDESLESCKSIHIEKNLTALSSKIECQKDDVNSGDELEIPVSDVVTEVHLKSDSQFEFSDIHNDSVTVATRDIDEVKRQDDEIKEDISPVNKTVSFDEVSSSSNAKSPADGFLETINPPISNEVMKDPATTNGHQISSQLDLGDAYKLAISTKGKLSGKLLDQKSFSNSSTRITEDLKILLSHRSNDSLISPKLSFNSDELTGLQFLQSRIPLERNESNISIDGSVVTEIEGEGVVDRLRRQVEHDKKLMSILYKELEEERNASAVATNQAMAMITRLQEEKAALYTEALQTLRMMEEQAEYDNEALQKANDIIELKDKQIQELEELLRKMSENVIE